MTKENEPRTGQIVSGGRAVGYWLLTGNGALLIGSGNDMRQVEPGEINLERLKNFPIELLDRLIELAPEK